jgi:hypothetical protein
MHYPSPTAVFDAYRKARENREWRTCFSFLTPEAQNDAVFEDFFACAEHASKEEHAIVKEYVDGTTLNDDYEKKYKEKHGIDLPKLRAGRETDPTFVPPPPDRDLLRDVVAAHVKDKAGFFEANAKLSEKNPVSPLGDLEQLVIDDDTATGRAATPGFHYETPGKTPRKVEDKTYKAFHFRRVNGGWLLDLYFG